MYSFFFVLFFFTIFTIYIGLSLLSELKEMQLKTYILNCLLHTVALFLLILCIALYFSLYISND